MNEFLDFTECNDSQCLHGGSCKEINITGDTSLEIKAEKANSKQKAYMCKCSFKFTGQSCESLWNIF